MQESRDSQACLKENRTESCARFKAWSKSTEPRLHGLETAKTDTLSLSRPLNSLQGLSIKQASNQPTTAPCSSEDFGLFCIVKLCPFFVALTFARAKKGILS